MRNFILVVYLYMLINGNILRMTRSFFNFNRSSQADNDPKPQKVLLLISDTGGGHRASAQALEHALRSKAGQKIDVEILDLWTQHGKWPFNVFVPGYDFLSKNPSLWKIVYEYTNHATAKQWVDKFASSVNRDKFKEALMRSNADCVVSLHPMCQSLPLSILQEINKEQHRNVPFVTVITDLGSAHSWWFDKRVDLCFVSSNDVMKLAIKYGIDANKIRFRGLPVRPSFWTPSRKSKEQIRQELGLKQHAKTILLMGGGNGVGGIRKIANSLVNTLRELNITSQLVVICGRNQYCYNSLINGNATKSLVSNNSTSTSSIVNTKVNVIVKGFVENIHEYMLASDCLISKAGPGTIAESMICGLPIILSSYLPGQETGNVPFVVEGGFGKYTGNDPDIIAKEVSSLLLNDSLLVHMSNNAKSQSHRDAAIEIASDISEILKSKQ